MDISNCVPKKNLLPNENFLRHINLQPKLANLQQFAANRSTIPPDIDIFDLIFGIYTQFGSYSRSSYLESPFLHFLAIAIDTFLAVWFWFLYKQLLITFLGIIVSIV
jgi:hypothetical protein